jgi:hypothetical protein
VRLNAILLLAALFLLAACASPENARTRGGGPGADIGNKGKVVRMHEGSDPFAKTPKLIPAQGPPLDGARQAHQRSR